MDHLILGSVIILGIGISFAFIRLFELIKKQSLGDLPSQLDFIQKSIEKMERSTQEALGKGREEQALYLRQTREEISNSFKSLGDSVLTRLAEISNMQKNQLDAFAGQLSAFKVDVNSNNKQAREELSDRLSENLKSQKERLDIFVKQLQILTESSDSKLEKMRETIERRLESLQQDNSQKLELMRSTVEEKLQGTLEKRLGESFKQVSERLELVHKGLGEMQVLATGVGDLKKVLTNIKSRGTWGEIQLGALLEQVLSPDQYSKNVCINPASQETVEYAIRLPGRSKDKEDIIWLPIDSKFPQEDYQRLVEAQDAGDKDSVDVALKSIEISLKSEAKKIRDKYICPPHSTDFGVMFLPTEGLFAEVIRRPGLCDFLQRVHRITVAGPTTLAAFLNSLQMGFRTLAVEKRSSEVWQLLGAVKTEFGKFGTFLEKVEKQLRAATNSVEDAAKKSRTIESKLRKVESLPEPDSKKLLGDLADDVEVIPRQSEIPSNVSSDDEVPF